MSIFRALDAAASALIAQQRAMDVISNNIANAHTPGYAREEALLAPRADERIGGVVLGRGVHVAAVRRIVDPLLEKALTGAEAQTRFWQTQAEALQNLSPIFGNLAQTRLADALNRFFSAWQGLAAQPADPVQKALVRDAAQTLADTIRTTRAELVQAGDALRTRLGDGIARVNAILDEIAQINAELARLESQPNAPAGNLRNRRAALLQELASWIPFQQVQNPKGELMLATPGGGLLLAGTNARHLAVQQNAQGKLTIVWAKTGAPAQGLDQGGRIGAWLQLHNTRIAGYLQSLDAWAGDLAFRVNALHGSHAQADWTSAASNPALPISDPAQPNALAARVVSGSFTVHLYDATGAPVQPGGYAITIVQGTTTMNDIAAQLSALPGVIAQVDAAGRLVIHVQNGTLAFGQDTSGFLAAYGLGGVFQGHDAATIQLAPAVAASADAIAPGYADPTTSAIAPADGTAAQAIFWLASSDLPTRLDAWIAGFGTDLQQAQTRAQSAQAARDALAQRREQISGVNTDEEMIAMMRAQRAFEAAAKAIATTNRMLDALMGVIR